MPQRPPRAGSIPPGFSLSRRLSERARAGTAGATGAGAPDPGRPPADGLGGIVEALHGALHGLIDQLSEAARAATAKNDQDHDPDQPPGRAPQGAPPRDGSGGVVHSVELGGKGGRMVFGYTLRLGLDGLSAEPFGDMPDKAAAAGAAPAAPAAPPARQPIVELFEEAATIVVVAELPGADPARLLCRVDGETLLIEAAGLVEAAGARRYRKQVVLPGPVEAAGMQQNFQNGILEVRLPRAAPR
jgi:HSP20 family protein